MRIAIYGAGSLGTILGAYISKAGVEIELINRNKAHIEALQTKGAHITGTVEFTQPVVAYTPDNMNGEYDVIFLMTKQQHNAEVVTMLKDYLAADGALATFQHGLPELQIAEILGEERVLGCTVAWGATLQGPGVCELTSAPDALSFSLGSISPKKNTAKVVIIVPTATKLKPNCLVTITVTIEATARWVMLVPISTVVTARSKSSRTRIAVSALESPRSIAARILILFTDANAVSATAK